VQRQYIANENEPTNCEKKSTHYLQLKIEQKKGVFQISMFNDRGYRTMGI